MKTEANNIDATQEIDKFINDIYPLNHFVIILFTMMCFCMPLSLFHYGAGLFFLTITFFTYSIILLMLVVLFKKRLKLGLSSKNYLGIAFNCVSCPPFAINLIRKITWQHKINPGLIEFAINKLSSADFSQLEHLLSRLDEQLLREDGNMAKSQQLKDYKCKLSELSK